jgi:hypothetical protein
MKTNSTVRRDCLALAISILVVAMATSAAATTWPKLTWDDVGHRGTLTPYTGPTTITVDGTVIDSKQITTTITVKANRVTIRNSRFQVGEAGRCLDFDSSTTGHLVENSTFEGSTNAQLYIRGGVTVRGSRFRDAEADLVKINGSNSGDEPVLFEGNYFQGIGVDGTSIHADGFQIAKDTSALVTLRGNTFRAPADPFDPVPPGGFLAKKYGEGTLTKVARPLFWGDPPIASSSQRAIVEYNHFEGGQTVITTDSIIQPGNVIFRFNTIGLQFRGGSAVGPWAGNVKKYGNVWAESGVVESQNIDSSSKWYGPWVAGELLPDQDPVPADLSSEIPDPPSGSGSTRPTAPVLLSSGS